MKDGDKVRVPWPEWQKGKVGVIKENFVTPMINYYVVDMGNGEIYTYKENEIELIKE